MMAMVIDFFKITTGSIPVVGHSGTSRRRITTGGHNFSNGKMDTIYRKFILEDRDLKKNRVVRVQMSKKKRAKICKDTIVSVEQDSQAKERSRKRKCDNNNDVPTRIKKSLQKKQDCFVITKGPAPPGKERYKLKAEEAERDRRIKEQEQQMRREKKEKEETERRRRIQQMET